MADRVTPPYAQHVGAAMGSAKRGKVDDLLRRIEAGEFGDRPRIARIPCPGGRGDDIAINGHKVTFLAYDELRLSTLDEHARDALAYGLAASRLHRPRSEKTLADFSDADLVMEMIRRGYAAMKLPADGGPPETLRCKD